MKVGWLLNGLITGYITFNKWSTSFERVCKRERRHLGPQPCWPRPCDDPVSWPVSFLICFSPLRLCTMRNCSDDPQFRDKQEGFLEYLNSTTLQWVPYCDSRFSEHNAQVVCRQMGMEPLNAWVSHGTRVEFHPNSLTRIWSWPEPVQCTGQCFYHISIDLAYSPCIY